ncbi:MAG: transcription elongation factor GreA [Oligoflexia bacterium]|nr:transcription elongation factor GreA [Oligoflexia bacterium]
MTLAGKKKLEDDLKRLMSVERPNIIKAIEEARAQGDISENAEYEAAKERQAFIEGKISEINSKLARAQVINPSSIKSDKVVFGATVVIEDLNANGKSSKKLKYQIVGVDESNVQEGLLSVASPLARAMIGKTEGDVISVNTPNGIKEYEIVEFFYE